MTPVNVKDKRVHNKNQTLFINILKICTLQSSPGFLVSQWSAPCSSPVNVRVGVSAE